MRTVLITLVLSLTFSAPAAAVTLAVPGDYASIGDALDAAQSGDTVLVACGIYEEYGLSLKSGVVLRSETRGAYCCTIDAGGQGRVLLAVDVDATASVIGFTFTGGLGGSGQAGGGVYCNNSSPVFENCIIRGNETQNGAGGGLACVNGSAASFTFCDFTWNRADGDGGGVYLDSSAPSFTDCQVLGNLASGSGGGLFATGAAFSAVHGSFAENTCTGFGGGVFLGNSSEASFSLDAFFGNHASAGGGGLAFDGSSPDLTSCTIAENSSAGPGAGIHVGGAASPDFTQVVVAFNTPFEGVSIAGGSAAFLCSNIHGNTGGNWTGDLAQQLGQDGNFEADPEFCGAESSGNYYLQMDSPCAPGNNVCGVLVGARIVDCGFIATQPTSWSTLKSMY